MDTRKTSQKIGGAILFLVVELAVAKFSEEYGWLFLILFGLIGLIPLAFGWWPEIQKRLTDYLAKHGSPAPTLPGRITYVEDIKDGNIRLHLTKEQLSLLRIINWSAATILVVVVLASLAVLAKIVPISGATTHYVSPQLPWKSSLGSFLPPSSAMKNNDGSPRIFVHETTTKLIDRFRDETALQAEDAAKPFLGKWIAISGTVAEIKPILGSVTVRLQEGTSPPVFPTFSGAQIERLKVYNAGDHFKAVCKITSLNADRLFLTECCVIP